MAMVLGVLLFLLPFVVSVRTYDAFVLPKNALLTAGIFIAGGVLGDRLLRESGRITLRFPASLAWLLAWTAISAVGAHSLLKASYLLMPFICGVALMALVGFIGQPGIRFLLWAVFAACLVESSYVIIQAAGVDFLRLSSKPLEGRWRAYGTLGNPNRVAWFLSTSSVMMSAYLVKSTCKHERRALLISLALCMAALMLTQSRGSLLMALVVLGSLCFVLWRKRDQGYRAVAGLMAAALLCIGAGLILAPSTMMARAADVGSIRGRVAHWREALELIREQPVFGVGWGNFEPAFARHVLAEPRPVSGAAVTLTALDHLHNEYLETAVETGLPGMLLLILLLGTLVRYGVRRAEADPLVLTSLVGLIQISLLSIYDFPFREPTTWILLWLNAGIILANSASRRQIKLRLAPTLQAGGRALLGALCLLVIYYLAARPVMADMHYLNSVRAIEAQNWTRALSEVDLAVGMAPYHADYLVLRKSILKAHPPSGTLDDGLQH
ncbi:MAG: O-antigen ligase family protein [Acidobacteria bacterium]|nr:O-antigen ligase family protein [Acidobacteriota bacterium]